MSCGKRNEASLADRAPVLDHRRILLRAAERERPPGRRKTHRLGMGRLERASVLGTLGGCDPAHRLLADPIPAQVEHRRPPRSRRCRRRAAPGLWLLRDSPRRIASAGPAQHRACRSVAAGAPGPSRVSAVYRLLEVLGRRGTPEGLAVCPALCRCRTATATRPARALEVPAAASLSVQHPELDLGAGTGGSRRCPADDRAVERSPAPG